MEHMVSSRASIPRRSSAGAKIVGNGAQQSRASVASATSGTTCQDPIGSTYPREKRWSIEMRPGIRETAVYRRASDTMTASKQGMASPVPTRPSLHGTPDEITLTKSVHYQVLGRRQSA